MGTQSDSPARDDEALLTNAEHTRAKHRILHEYLNAWFPIIGLTAGRIVYFDGFAGSGEYTDGTFGSPIIAIDCAKNHVLKDRMTKCEHVFLFTEINRTRFEHLRHLLEKRYGAWDEKSETFAGLPATYKFGLTHGDFNAVASDILTELEKNKSALAPTMAFIDPFGYELNIDILARILRFRRCELLITYMVGFMDRFLTEEKHRGSILRTLKTTQGELDAIAGNPEVGERELALLLRLNDAISEAAVGQDKPPAYIYHLYFKMLDRSNHTLYYLVFFTKSLAGIKVMKEAMWKAGREGTYMFSDYDFQPGQTSLLDYSKEKPWQAEAGETLYSVYVGQKVSVEQVEEYILGWTPWIWRAGILRSLEEQDKIRILTGRTRRFTYPKGTEIQFGPFM